CANRYGQHEEAEFGGKDASAIFILGVELQQSGREHPDRGTAKVSSGQRQACHPEPWCKSNPDVTQGQAQIATKNSQTEPALPLVRPARGEQRPEHRSEAARSAQ